MDVNHIYDLKMLQSSCSCLRMHNRRNAYACGIPTTHWPSFTSFHIHLLALYFLLRSTPYHTIKWTTKVTQNELLRFRTIALSKSLEVLPKENFTKYKGLSDYFRGKYEIRNVAALAICENKSLPRSRNLRSLLRKLLKVKLETLYTTRLKEVYNSIEEAEGIVVIFPGQTVRGLRSPCLLITKTPHLRDSETRDSVLDKIEQVSTGHSAEVEKGNVYFPQLSWKRNRTSRFQIPLDHVVDRLKHPQVNEMEQADINGGNTRSIRQHQRTQPLTRSLLLNEPE
ncbi:hypothetical protein CERSUDRAFT_73094 [Gelatoporia subvermispora B]|uniref:Uncharacterized protein n=1 Tax=Ceriporiopsis subvermispora (strain B) TaxID=914234 RepID=M2RJJ4_CERS8|nr:hypothetical protein CERSUDRAFT_73094 [Gelatoporia subvermispora B]